MAEQNDKPRIYVVRKVADPQRPPRLFSTWGRKELAGRFAMVSGNLLRSWKLYPGHYLTIEGGCVFELFIMEDGSQNLYDPDFIPHWLTAIVAEVENEVTTC